MRQRRDQGQVGEGIRTKHIALVESISGNDCMVLASGKAHGRGRRLVVWSEVRRTGDAQVGLACAVHDAGDAQ